MATESVQIREQVRTLVTGYVGGRIPLWVLASELEPLLRSQEGDSDTNVSAIDAWLQLEEVNAIILARAEQGVDSQATEEEVAVVMDALGRIVALLDE